MPEPILNSSRVVAFISQRVATGVTEHVDVHREGEAGALTDALHKAVDGVGGERSAPPGSKT
jgi:hypothetical protein